MFRSSPPEVFSNKGTVQIRSEPTGEQTRRSAILTKLLCNFIEIKPTHGCTPGNSHHTRKTPLPRRTHLCCCWCCCCCCYFFSFFFPFFFFSFSYYLYKPSNYIITIIITIMFINITAMGVLEESSRGEFQTRNSSGMFYPY